MNDFDSSLLYESRSEWCVRLINILTPHIMEGLHLLLRDSVHICRKANENEKYLITFQNTLRKIPLWTKEQMDEEVKRIVKKSKCTYLAELITCVHVMQLKLLTMARAGHKPKTLQVDIPDMGTFLKQVYSNAARKAYAKTFLFQQHLPPLIMQQHQATLETVIRECIHNTIRDNIPVEQLLQAYLSDATEEHVDEHVEETYIDVPVHQHGGGSQVPVEPVQVPVEPVQVPTVQVPTVQVPTVQVPAVQVPVEPPPMDSMAISLDDMPLEMDVAMNLPELTPLEDF